MENIHLNGNNLTIEKIKRFIDYADAFIVIDNHNYSLIEKSHQFLAKIIENNIDTPIYGINTGFGPMANHVLGKNLIIDLQENLIRSHAVGMGSPIPSKFILAMMLVRLNTLIQGCSGISKELANHFLAVLNHRIIPKVPEHGSVGASGDLVQLAHIALVLIGEGQALYQEQWMSSSTIFSQLKINSYQLKPKEGLSLINGTAAMSGISAVVTAESEQALDLAVRLSAFSYELLNASEESIDAFLSDIRPHPGQAIISEKLRKILSESQLFKQKNKNNQKADLQENNIYKLSNAIQEVYSIRCIPQILGPIQEAIQHCREKVTIEINSVTDNPVLDITQEKILHGGNFHGDYISFAIDQLKISLVKLTLWLERKINFFLHSKINNYFPPFLNLNKPGLTLALQGLQFVATSTAARSQSLGFPHYLHSISTNGDNQDIVSMGTDAALIADKALENLYILLTIDMIVLSQATDYLNANDLLSPSSQSLYQQVREIFPTWKNDVAVDSQLETLLKAIRENK
jgi:histidine ammonia-lyase